MPDKLNMKDAAKFLGIEENTLRNWLWKKKPGLRSYKFAGRVYFDRKDLEAFKRSLIEVRVA